MKIDQFVADRSKNQVSVKVTKFHRDSIREQARSSFLVDVTF